MVRFYPRGLLFLFLPFISESREIPTHTISASREEDVTLPCFKSALLAPGSCYRVKWTKLPTDHSGRSRVILARPQMAQFQDAERVKWGADGNGHMALSLRSLNKSDEGVYSCEIWEGWDRILAKNIVLKVKDCKTLDAVKAAPGTVAHLHCPVDTTSQQRRPQNVSWVMLKGGVENPISLNSEMVEMNGTQLAMRVNFGDSGWFRCKYLRGQSQHCFDLNLRVQKNAFVATTAFVVTVPVATTETVQAMTASENMGETKKEESRAVFITLVSSLPLGFALIASLMGLIIYRRCYTKRPVQNAQRNPGVITQCNDRVYESVGLPCSEEHTILRVNSLYTHFQDEGLYTFQSR